MGHHTATGIVTGRREIFRTTVTGTRTPRGYESEDLDNRDCRGGDDNDVGMSKGTKQTRRASVSWGFSPRLYETFPAYTIVSQSAIDARPDFRAAHTETNEAQKVFRDFVLRSSQRF